ncbi:MAG: S-layer homology domain-containing protein, partial [Clostridia bacterium]|nr:S-layer homology domain-containing protein [Clostridia bacterium]
MRKMNKIVALSLVLAMAFSMLASAASFKDQATINADLMDEINLLVALGVYSEQGTGAGYFEPNGTITRSQAAKIIYVLKNKGVDNGAASWTDMNIFSDVEVGSWYEGYVNYCASVGILAGTGDNKFTPNGQLTGVELAKMLLVVIGYKADVEGYTGAKWAENIIADAEAAGIFVDYELPVKGIVTREWAAQMIVNALNATKVKYEDGEAVEMYNSDNEAITYMAQDLGLKQYHANLIATPNVKLVQNGSAANNTNGKNKLSAVGTFANPITFEFDANPELLGSKVTVLYKGTSLANATKIYGVTAHVENVITDTTVDAVEFDAEDFEASVYFYVDYDMQDNMDAEDLETFFDANDGRALKMIDRDDDGQIDVMMTNAVAYDKIDYINPANHIVRFVVDDTLDISGGATADREEAWEKVNFVDSVVADDIVKITKDFSTGKEITNIELVDVVTGAVTKKSGSTYTIDGGSYKLSAFAFEGTSITVNSTAKNYYVDGQYVICSDDISDNEVKNTNVAYVIKAGLQAGTWEGTTTKKVDILKNDGTRETLTYKTYAEDATLPTGYVEFSENLTGGLYEYVMKDGKVYFK